MEVLILSGMSGSGKSSALNILEDIGYLAIDNFPGELLQPLLELARRKSARYRRLALVMDVRDRGFADQFKKYLQLLKREGAHPKTFFFDARDDVILRRFSETRRPHPLGPKGSVSAAVQKERALLQPIRESATGVIDTSQFNVHDLRKALLDRLGKHPATLTIHLVSFGYRFGIPLEADLVIDLRFLPNPHFVPKLRPHSGQNSRVKNYVLKKKETLQFLRRFEPVLRMLLRGYQKEGKSYLTLAFGCTGGRHRSVVIAEAIGKDLPKWGYAAKIIHRDVARGA